MRWRNVTHAGVNQQTIGAGIDEEDIAIPVIAVSDSDTVTAPLCLLKWCSLEISIRNTHSSAVYNKSAICNPLYFHPPTAPLRLERRVDHPLRLPAVVQARR